MLGLMLIKGKKRVQYIPRNRDISPDEIIEVLESMDTPPVDEELMRLRFEDLKRQIHLRQRLLQQCVTSKEVQEIFDDQTRQNINQKTLKGDLLAIRDKGRWWYPLWQFDANGPDRMVAGLEKVSKAIHGTMLEKIAWLSTKNRAFEDRSPIDILKAGETDRVLAEAAGIGAAAF